MKTHDWLLAGAIAVLLLLAVDARCQSRAPVGPNPLSRAFNHINPFLYDYGIVIDSFTTTPKNRDGPWTVVVFYPERAPDIEYLMFCGDETNLLEKSLHNKLVLIYTRSVPEIGRFDQPPVMGCHHLEDVIPIFNEDKK